MAIEMGPTVHCAKCAASVSTIETQQYGLRLRSHSCRGVRSEQRGLLGAEMKEAEAEYERRRETARRDAGASAIISDDGLYRYELRRRLAEEPTIGPSSTILWVMLNPSTADASLDDPTIRKCLGFTRMIAASARKMIVCNLYAFRETSPARLRAAKLRGADIVGPDCDRHLTAAFGEADAVICAWGAHANGLLRTCGGPQRAGAVLALLSSLRPGWNDVRCLGRSSCGAPRHPLMLPYDTPLESMLPAKGCV